MSRITHFTLTVKGFSKKPLTVGVTEVKPPHGRRRMPGPPPLERWLAPRNSIPPASSASRICSKRLDVHPAPAASVLLPAMGGMPEDGCSTGSGSGGPSRVRKGVESGGSRSMPPLKPLCHRTGHQPIARQSSRRGSGINRPVASKSANVPSIAYRAEHPAQDHAEIVVIPSSPAAPAPGRGHGSQRPPETARRCDR